MSPSPASPMYTPPRSSSHRYEDGRVAPPRCAGRSHYKMARVALRGQSDPLATFHPAVGAWFVDSFGQPTRAQALAWPPIACGESTLVLAPTGSGKTLAAFLWSLNRLMFGP